MKKTTASPAVFLWPFIRPHLATLCAGLIAVAVAGVSVLFVGQVFRFVIDHGMASGNGRALYQGIAGMAALVLLLAACSYCRLVWLNRVAEKALASLRDAALGHMLHADLAWMQKQKTGDLLARLTADTALLQVLISVNLPIALRNVVLVLGGLVLMVISSPHLSLFLVTIIPVLILLLRLQAPKVRLRSKELQQAIGYVGGQMGEALAAMREIQAFTQEETQQKNFAQVNQQAVTAAMSYARQRAVLVAGIMALVFSGVTLLLFVGGQQVMQGTLTGGALTSFIFYAVLVAGAAATLSELYGDWQRACAALQRIQEILNVPSSLVVPTTHSVLPDVLPVLPQQLVFEDVTFAYPARADINVTQNVTLALPLTGTVAFVGGSGAGKTTLFDLILRFYDPKHGRLVLDGIDIRSYDLAVYRSLFALVPQQPSFFSQTIAENIAFGRDVTAAQIEEAARAAQAHDFITALPAGYHTVLGERGAQLSGGQLQRIALARAFVTKASVLLLDEATAHLDAVTEQALHHALAAQKNHRAVWIIAHRLATVQHVDQIVVLDQGRIVATGTHDALITTNNLYQNLVRTHFATEAS